MTINYLDTPPPKSQPKEYLPFWEGTRKGELRFPRCRSCGKFHWYPQLMCPHCQSMDIEWVTTSGRGKVFTWTVVRHAFMPAYKKRLPFIVALVDIDDAPGVRLVTNIIETRPEEMEIGLPVEVAFERAGEEFVLPVFKRAR